MNYQKLDAGLAAVLSWLGPGQDPILDAFVGVNRLLGSREFVGLANLGVDNAEGKRVFTVRLAASKVATLTDQDWVQYVRLGRTLQSMTS